MDNLIFYAMEVAPYAAGASLLLLIYLRIRDYLGRRKMAAILAEYGAITEPVVISSYAPNDVDVEHKAAYVRYMLKEANNTWLNPNTDVIAIPYNGYHDGGSLIGMSFGQYRRYVQQVELKAMKEFHQKAAAADAKAASANITGQDMSFEYGIGAT